MLETTKELLLLLEEVLDLVKLRECAGPTSRLRATQSLALIFRRRGDHKTADRLLAAPTLTPAPSIVALSHVLTDPDVGRAIGLMAAGRDQRKVARGMMSHSNGDDLGDLVEALSEDARLG